MALGPLLIFVMEFIFELCSCGRFEFYGALVFNMEFIYGFSFGLK
jgi:hypothetical protein